MNLIPATTNQTKQTNKIKQSDFTAQKSRILMTKTEIQETKRWTSCLLTWPKFGAIVHHPHIVCKNRGKT